MKSRRGRPPQQDTTSPFVLGQKRDKPATSVDSEARIRNPALLKTHQNRQAQLQSLLQEKRECANFKKASWVEAKSAHQGRKWTKNLKQILNQDERQTHLGSYQSLDAGFSVDKPRKYCDFVGFSARYTDPKTGLRYYNSEFYPLVQSLTAGQKD